MMLLWRQVMLSCVSYSLLLRLQYSIFVLELAENYRLDYRFIGFMLTCWEGYIMNSAAATSQRANLFVIAAPSGAGKTSLVNAMVNSTALQIQVAVSYTTRPPRPADKDGVDYHFVDKNTFQKMIDEQKLLEYATVFNNYYGTSKAWVEAKMAQGQDVILEIDWQGARQIRRNFPQHAVLIFILPPSMRDLQQRVEQRKQDSSGVIKQRLLGAREEIRHCNEFDYLVVNDDFDQALVELQSIVSASRLVASRQLSQHKDLLADLLDDVSDVTSDPDV